jgi:hypothetical protein
VRVRSSISQACRARLRYRGCVKRLVGATIVVLLTAWAWAQQQGANPVRTTVSTFVVTQEVQAGGGRVELLTPSLMGEPGQTVEYQVRVENTSVEMLPAGVVVVTLPILPGTRYIDLSASRASDRLITEFTAHPEPLTDAALYSAENVFVLQGGVRSIADPTAYTGIRWTLLQTLDPGEGVTLKYRVTILGN